MERHPNNPIITREQIPEISPHLIDVSSVFNPGATRFQDKIILLLRVQNRGRETFLLMAESINGIDFNISDELVHFRGIESIFETSYHIYDPRITRIQNEYFILFAMDLASGCHLGLAKTDDFHSFEFIGMISKEPTRNGVLFPEMINDSFLMLDRPNKVHLDGGPQTGGTIVLSYSQDLRTWRSSRPVFSGRSHYWDELIGPGPPPIRTRQGWLLIYHGIAMHYQPIYQAGVVLLDLEDPSHVKNRGKYNILEPREMYETVGQVPNVVFPSGLVVEEYDTEGFAKLKSQVFLYYGAADTSVCLAVSTVEALVNASKM